MTRNNGRSSCHIKLMLDWTHKSPESCQKVGWDLFWAAARSPNSQLPPRSRPSWSWTWSLWFWMGFCFKDEHCNFGGGFTVWITLGWWPVCSFGVFPKGEEMGESPSTPARCSRCSHNSQPGWTLRFESEQKNRKMESPADLYEQVRRTTVTPTRSASGILSGLGGSAWTKSKYKSWWCSVDH